MQLHTALRLALIAFGVSFTASLHATRFTAAEDVRQATQSTVQFTETNYMVLESAGAVTLTVQRTGDLRTRVSVDYVTADGTATNGLKYSTIAGTLIFEATETNKFITVAIMNNGWIEGTKDFRVILGNPRDGAVLGARENAIVLITDNDLPVRVEFPGYEGREEEAAVQVGVFRGDDGEFPVNVDYATSHLGALPGEDYVETTGQLTFGARETLKFVNIPIRNDALKEADETLRFTLSNPIGTILSINQKSATITIKDNDPGVGFLTRKYYIHEDESALEVTVHRGNDLALQPFTVDYATLDGTGLAGEDYVATKGTLAFAAGELSRSIRVPLINDGLLELDESFQVALSRPTGGASLGALTNLLVYLCDSTGMAAHGFAAIHPETDGVVKLSFAGGVSKRFLPYFDLYPLEQSANLVDWRPLALFQRINSASDEQAFVDPAGIQTPMRFYRVPTNHFIAAYPRPTGPFALGRVVRMIDDPTRRNRYGVSTNGSFAISIFYPATPEAGQLPARWFEEKLARDTGSKGAFTPWHDRMPHFSSYCYTDAPLADLVGPLPVILFSPGTHVDRTQDTEKLENLASHGYLVVSVEHFDAYNVAWPNGFYYSRSSGVIVTPEGLKDRVRDLSLVLDKLTKWNQDEARFAGRIDLSRVGAMGMSWGGATVADFAQRDSRCRAVVLLDPGGFDESMLNFPRGFSKPSLTMHNPDNSEQLIFTASRTNAVWFQISGTDHGSFANEIMFSSASLTDKREAARTIQAYTVSFFNRWLVDQDDHLYENRSPDFTSVINLQRK